MNKNEPIIDLTREDWIYHSLIAGILKIKEYPDIKENEIDYLCLFYEENNNKKCIGRLKFHSGNIMSFEKKELKNDELNNISIVPSNFDIISYEIFTSKKGKGNEILEAMEKSKNLNLNFKKYQG